MLAHARALGLVGALALTLGASTARGELVAEDPAPHAIQERKYRLGEELRLAIGSMPLDPFQKGWTLSLSHTHHFDERWAWEVTQVTFALLESTSLREELIGTFARLPSELSAPRAMLTTGIELTPFYGKQVWLNQDTLHGTLFLGVYGGVILGDRPTFSEMLEDIRPSLGAGIGTRVFMSEHFSSRFDARLYASLRPEVVPEDELEVESVLLLTLSISLGFGQPSSEVRP